MHWSERDREGPVFTCCSEMDFSMSPSSLLLLAAAVLPCTLCLKPEAQPRSSFTLSTCSCFSSSTTFCKQKRKTTMSRGSQLSRDREALSGAAPETQPKCGTEKLRADVREAKQHPWGARKRTWTIGMEFSSVQYPYLLFLQAPQSIADVLHVLRG